jgi:hypothetical protein
VFDFKDSLLWRIFMANDYSGKTVDDLLKRKVELYNTVNQATAKQLETVAVAQSNEVSAESLALYKQIE